MGEDIQLKKEKYEDFYRKLREKIFKWVKEGKLNNQTKGWAGRFTEYLIILPDLLYMMIKILFDKEVPVKSKALIVVATTYLFSPIDVIPDFIPVVGFVDDLLVTIIILNRIINSDDPVLKQKMKEYWPGDEDIFLQIKNIMAIINQFASEIPKGILKFMNEGKNKGGKN